MIRQKNMSDPIGRMKQPEDELISKRQLVMWLANMQMGTNPHSKEGQFEWEALESVLQYVVDMVGVPINVKENEDGEKVQPTSETKHPW